LVERIIDQSAFKALGGGGAHGLTFREPAGNVEAVSGVYATGGTIQTDEVTGDDAFEAAPGEDEFVLHAAEAGAAQGDEVFAAHEVGTVGVVANRSGGQAGQRGNFVNFEHAVKP